MSERKAFLIYREWATILAKMPEEQAGQLIKAICAKEIGTEYQITDPMVEAVFDGWSLQLDKDSQNYEDICASRRKAAESRWHQKDTDAVQEDASACKSNEVHPNKNKNKNKNNNKDKNIGATSRPTFQKPTVEEVAEYCRERGNHVSAEQFVSWYDSNGWKVGKNPMKDWKAAVRTWEQRDNQRPAQKKPAFNNFQQHDYDFSALEKALGG